MPASTAEEGLLFGILALQMDFISREELIAATSVWVVDKARHLDDILGRHGRLSADETAAISTLVRKHLERESSIGSRHEAHATAAHVGTADARDPHGTVPPCGTAVGEATGAAKGEQGRYQCLRPLAQGGLGQVSLARDDALNREVALKELAPRHAHDAELRRRFLREAEITGRLEHPGVVPVYSVGTHPDGRPFYAMRLIRGETLKAAVDRFHHAGPAAPLERLVALHRLLARFVAVCRTMEFAHRRGVLHRDLKPGNIMLGPCGETLIVDWGLAKCIATDGGEEPLELAGHQGDDLTQKGIPLGTPGFMSPEQATGCWEQLSPASDVYNLGATLYYALTGRPSIEEASLLSMLDRVRNGVFPPPRAVRPQVCPELERICLRAMALSPGDRYAAAAVLADDVERWMASQGREAQSLIEDGFAQVAGEASPDRTRKPAHELETLEYFASDETQRDSQAVEPLAFAGVG